MTDPVQTCSRCGVSETVTPSPHGFPPEQAKRRLQQSCKQRGHTADPIYTAGTR